MIVKKYNHEWQNLWDEFVNKCPMATFLHSRKFLSYHGGRFADQSLLILDDKERLCGVFPAAVNPSDDKSIVSHPGSTFGGILHQGKLLGSQMLDALQAVMDFYKDAGFRELIYKAIPYIYHQNPAADDLYALFALNACLYRRDLSCAIDLNAPSILAGKDQYQLRKAIRKADKNGLLIKEGAENLPKIWEIITANLKAKYGASPVHSLPEIESLSALFPDQIRVIGAFLADELVAGGVLFLYPEVMHAQYLTTTDKGMQVVALDALAQHYIAMAKKANFRYFNFGISNENQGKVLNNSLYLSKAKHGGSGIIHDFYRITLE